MPEFIYQGRDKEGKLKSGHRYAQTLDTLNNELIREGIAPIDIRPYIDKRNYLEEFQEILQGRTLFLQELSTFARQMQVLHHASVPIVTSLKQLALYTRSLRLKNALIGVVEFVEKGQSLASAMEHFPETFSPLMVDVVQIGENTGHLDEAFAHIHKYLEFELKNRKQIKSAFRYPMFVTISILIAIIILNIFVIPSFSRFYTNAHSALPWQTRLLIGSSNFIINYGWYTLIAIGILFFSFHRYVKSKEGRYNWDKFKFSIPFFGNLLTRVILIRFAQSMAIMIKSGIPLTQALKLVKNILQNTYINQQIINMQEMIERGNSFTQAMSQLSLLSPMEMQILSVGEKNGEIDKALDYISDFHALEIEYDLKKLNDYIGPILIGFISVLILIVALGVYLPIWNMVNLMK